MRTSQLTDGGGSRGPDRVPGEHVAVLDRTTTSWTVTLAPDARRTETLGSEHRTLVSVARDGVEGRAEARGRTAEALREAAGAARAHQARKPVPLRRPVPATTATAVTFGDLHRLAGAVAAAVTETMEVVVTVAATRRAVTVTAAGEPGSRHVTIEAQVHVRAAAPELRGVQAAWLDASFDGFRGDELARDLGRVRHNLSAPPVGLGQVDWLLLSPLATARLLSRVVPSLRDAVSARRPGFAAPGAVIGSDAVTLTATEEPPWTRAGGGKTLIRRGRVCPAERDDRDEFERAAERHVLLPTADAATAAALPGAGTGLVVERLFGFRAGLDLASTQLQVEVEGMAAVEGRELGRGRLVLTATPVTLLTSVCRVGPATPYRINGLYGGAWCLLRGLPVEQVDIPRACAG